MSPDIGWKVAMIVCGLMVVIMGVVLFLLLVPSPLELPFNNKNENDNKSETQIYQSSDSYDLVDNNLKEKLIDYPKEELQPVGFCRALFIPGVYFIVSYIFTF